MLIQNYITKMILISTLNIINIVIHFLIQFMILMIIDTYLKIILFRRWQKIGGEIWLDPNTKLNHIGTYTFEGDVGKIINRGNPKS